MQKVFALLALFFISCSHTAIQNDERPITFATIPSTRTSKTDHEAKAKKYMIATQGEAATKAATEIFHQGGNIIDAAAAASFAISVERPQSTGIGGGGFMLIHLAQTKKTVAVDFREKAPKKSRKDMFLDEQDNIIPNLSTDGVLSVGVPGLVAGIVEIHKRYGKLSLQKVLEPAIILAEKGFPVYPELVEAIVDRQDVLKRFHDSKKIFLHKDGTPLREGEILVQKDLARTLKRIAEKGAKGFYKGQVAQAIIKTQKKYGGLITKDDFDSYDVKFRMPIHSSYKFYDIASMPPPSSGGVHVVEILNILENLNLKEAGAFSPQAVHWTASAMQRAFADRAQYLGDSDFVNVPLDGLTSKSYAKEILSKIHPTEATASKEIFAGNPLPYEPRHTTHFTIMDGEGNAVTSTQTINDFFGSGVVAEGTGIVLNNEMDDFSAKPGAANIYGAIGSENNSIEPEKRPLSSMSPTIVFFKGEPILALGTPSGTRIITCVAQTILNYLEYGMTLYNSIAAVRFHHQWQPDEIQMDEPGLPDDTQQALRRMGYHLKLSNLGCRVNAVAKEKGILHGVADPRGEGMSVGE